MNSRDTASRVVADMDRMDREMSDRRALRERSREMAKQQSAENFRDQGQTAEKVAQYLSRNASGKRVSGTREEAEGVFDASNLMEEGSVEDGSDAPDKVEQELIEINRGPRHRKPPEPDFDGDDEDFSKTSWIN